MLAAGQVAAPIQGQLFDEETKARFECLIPRERWAAVRSSRQSRSSKNPVLYRRSDVSDS